MRIDVSHIAHPDRYNDIYYPLLYTDRRYNILYGGRDTGKSTFIAQKLVLDCLTLPYFKCILIRKQGNTIRHSSYSEIEKVVDMWGLRKYFAFNKSLLEIRCQNGNSFISKGMDDPLKAKSLSEPTHAWFEEADQLLLYDWETMSFGLRNSRGVKIQEWISFNPDNPKNWIPKTFFPPFKSFEKPDGSHQWVDSTQPDTYILHTCYLHNQFLSEDSEKKMDGLKYTNPLSYKKNGLGLFVKDLEGLIYPDYTIIEDFPYREAKHSYIGGDFGYTDPNAFARVGWNARRTRLYLDELIYESHLDDNQLIKKMIQVGISKTERGYLDSSEPGTIAAINKAGFKGLRGAKKDRGSVKAGIKMVKAFELFVTKRSKNLIYELDNYRISKDRNGQHTGEPEDLNNHLMDAIRYPVYTSGVTKRSKVTANIRQ